MGAAAASAEERAGGARPAEDVRVPLRDVLDKRVKFVQTAITGFDFAGQQLLTEAGAPAVEMMRTIKRALDPHNIMNPGKIFML